MAEGDAGAVDLTKARGAAGDFGHQRSFTKTHLAQPLAEILVSLQFTNASRDASGKLAER